MKTKIYHELTDQLYTEWEHLWKRSAYANPFNSAAWFKAAILAFRSKTVVIVAVYNDAEALVAIAGFCRQRLFGIPVYLVPAIEFADNQSLLVDFSDKKITKFFLNEISRLGNVYITNLHENIREQITANLPTAYPFISDVNAFIDVIHSPQGDFPNRRKATLINRVKNGGDTLAASYTFREHKAVLETAFQIDQTSAKSRKGKSIFDRPNVRHFFNLLAHYLDTHFLTTILSFSGKPSGYHIGFISNNVYSGNQKAHLGEFNYYNPGKIMELGLLKYLAGKGIAEYDFGRGYDNFKMMFTKQTRLLYNCIITDNSLVGYALPRLFKIRSKLYEVISVHRRVYKIYKNVIKKIESSWG